MREKRRSVVLIGSKSIIHDPLIRIENNIAVAWASLVFNCFAFGIRMPMNVKDGRNSSSDPFTPPTSIRLDLFTTLSLSRKTLKLTQCRLAAYVCLIFTGALIAVSRFTSRSRYKIKQKGSGAGRFRCPKADSPWLLASTCTARAPGESPIIMSPVNSKSATNTC